MPPSSPEDSLNRTLLRELAGDRSYARGEAYFADGRVRQLYFGGDRVSARVTGSQAYRVKLWRGRGELQFSCTCPVGRESAFCKHCVAVGLAWLAGAEGQPDPEAVGKVGKARGELSRQHLHNHLRSLAHEVLVELMLEATDYDDILRRRLLLETIGLSQSGRKGVKGASPKGPLPDLAAYRQILHESIECLDYVEYDAMPDYAQGVEEAIKPFAQLIKTHPGAVVELAEFALIELDRSSEMLDGSDGSLNSVYDDLQNYHFQACRAAHPDSGELAERLLNYELEGGFGIFNNAYKTYAEVLGPRGKQAWRERLMAEWSALPAITPSSGTRHRAGLEPIDHRRFQLQALAERLAEAEGDLELLATVKQRDLSSPEDFLSVAEVYQTARQPVKALEWAMRGCKEFPDLVQSLCLREFIVAAHHREGRHDAAVKMVWQEFERFHNLESYRRLKTHAQLGGMDWDKWHERALKFLRQHIPAERRKHRERDWDQPPDHSALVEILLAEVDDDAAWNEAVKGGCSESLWMQLASRREADHPADALKVYQAQLDPTIARAAYKEAVALISQVQHLLERLGRQAEFAGFREQVRAAHPKKRNFLKLLDALAR